jgi:hypothetical protein
VLDEQFHDAADADLLVVVEAPEPSSEFVGALNLPRTRGLCHVRNKSSRVILWTCGLPCR